MATSDLVVAVTGASGSPYAVRLVEVLLRASRTVHLTISPAAVEVKGGFPKNRPCVVVAGGREPPGWEAYPHHQFLHTVGALPCCDNGGCWKSRTVPLGDGDAKDRPENLCSDVVGGLPHCMDMITADDVIRRIEMYLDGVTRPLTPAQASSAQAAIAGSLSLTTESHHHIEAELTA